MSEVLNWERAGYVHSHYKGHDLAVTVKIATDNTLSDDEKYQIQKKANEIAEILQRNYYTTDQEEIRKAADIKRRLLECFPGGVLVYHHDIENRYSAGRLDKWLKVYTPKGPIVLGWRSHVINIDWSKSDIQQKGKDLFPEHQGTVEDDYIHAGSYQYAAEIIEKLLQ